MAKKKNGVINVGVVGLGKSGWGIHICMIRQVQDKYKIVAVSDPDKKRQKEAADEFNCHTYSRVDDLIKDPDVELVIVATPSHLHAGCSIKALKAGKHVVCEKPMATSLADADKMLKTAKMTGMILAPFQNRRYTPDFLKIKKIIDSGKLGRIVMIKQTWHGFGRRWDWQTLKKFGGGTLNNTAPHAIDVLLQLFGEKDPEEVFCHLERTLTLGDADDHVKIILKAKGQPMIDLEITSACAYPQESWLVMGTQGSLAGGAKELRWKYFDPKKLPNRSVSTKPDPNRAYNKEDIPWKEQTWKVPSGTSRDPDFYNDVYKTIRNGKPLYITPESVRRQIALIHKCHKMCPV
ncbi:MAG: Gfo/Idh/MocA family oxidoreductase [bacterium]